MEETNRGCNKASRCYDEDLSACSLLFMLPILPCDLSLDIKSAQFEHQTQIPIGAQLANLLCAYVINRKLHY
jgi:hypothetical protein